MNKSRIKRIIGVIIILIFFFFIGKSLVQNWHTLRDAKLKFQVHFLFLSYLCMFMTFVLVAYAWKKSLAMLNEKISLINALRINAIATLPKYAPGKVWGIVGKVYIAKKENISEHNCVITISLETILYLLGGVILFLLTSVSMLQGRIPFLIYLFVIPICLIIVYPPVLIIITNFFLKLFKRPIIDITPSYLQVLLLLLLYTLCWVLQGIGIFFLINSFYPIGIESVLVISGLHALSWVVGFLSIITPAGLGVKEGVFGYFLAFLIPAGIATITSLLVRVWGTIGELLYFFAFSGKIKKYL